ncbi:MAG: hypothetical protein WC738_04395 [Candidatus Omnitrophota bacterium]|jgi:hypothetical protein
MIQQIDNALFINEILQLADNIPDMQVKALEKMLIDGITSKNAKILVQKIDGKITSFVYAAMMEYCGEDVILIPVCYINPSDKYIGHEFMTRLNRWAEEVGFKSLIMITRRNPVGFERKYKFKSIATVLKREVQS